MKKYAAMIVFSYFPADTRVRREMEAYVLLEYTIDLFCLRGKGEKKYEKVKNLNIYRINLNRKRGTVFRYLFEYSYFFFVTFFKLVFLSCKKRYEISHIHNMPDFLAFTTIIPRLLGTKVILDLHDPMPEVFMSKYSLSGSHYIIKILKLIEKISILYSDVVITPNKAFLKLFISRGCPAEKINVIMNSPQENIFKTNNKSIDAAKFTKTDKFIIMYHGTIVERHGLDMALKALVILQKRIPNIVFNVYGGGDNFVIEFKKLINEYKLNNIVSYFGPVSVVKIAESIEKIDVGIIPNKRSVFTELNLPVRIFEYLCLRKPVIAPDTPGIRDYFSDDEIYFFSMDDLNSLVNCIYKVYWDLKNGNTRIISNGYRVYDLYRWELERKKLIDIINIVVG